MSLRHADVLTLASMPEIGYSTSTNQSPVLLSASDNPVSEIPVVPSNGRRQSEDRDQFRFVIRFMIERKIIKWKCKTPVERYDSRYHRDVIIDDPLLNLLGKRDESSNGTQETLKEKLQWHISKIQSASHDPWVNMVGKQDESLSRAQEEHRKELQKHKETVPRLVKVLEDIETIFDLGGDANDSQKRDTTAKLYESLLSRQELSAPDLLSWTPIVHPDGQLYFAKIGVGSNLRFVTDTNLRDKRNLRLIDIAVEHFSERFDKAGSKDQLLHRPEVFLSIVLDEDTPAYEYYIINTECGSPHGTFALDDGNGGDEVKIVEHKYVQSEGHLDTYLRAQYWTHAFYFPHEKIIQEHEWDELQKMLLYSSVESLLYSDSVTPFASEKVQKLVDLSEKLKERFHPVPGGTVNGHAQSLVGEQGNGQINVSELYCTGFEPDARVYIVASIAQMQSALYRTRFNNLYGQHNARLSRAQRIQKTYTQQRSLIWNVIFFAPHTYRRELESTWLSKVKDEDWRPFLTSLVEDWQQIVINSAVLLNANVAFLAVPGVIDSNGKPMSLEQIACYLSIVTSLCSIFSGLILLKRNSAELGRWEQRLQAYVLSYKDHQVGISAIAVMYSVPFVLLLWSTGFFAFSIAKVTFGFTPRSALQLSLFSCLWFFMCLICMWLTFVTQNHKIYEFTIRPVNHVVDFAYYQPLKLIAVAPRLPGKLMSKMKGLKRPWHGREEGDKAMDEESGKEFEQ